MLTVSSHALIGIAKHFQDRPRRPLRVTAEGVVCGSNALDLIEDRVREADLRFEREGFEIVVEKNFFAAAQPIDIDFRGDAFMITSAYRDEQGCCEDCCGC
jgi:hypothetical protein